MIWWLRGWFEDEPYRFCFSSGRVRVSLGLSGFFWVFWDVLIGQYKPPRIFLQRPVLGDSEVRPVSISFVLLPLDANHDPGGVRGYDQGLALTSQLGLDRVSQKMCFTGIDSCLG